MPGVANVLVVVLALVLVGVAARRSLKAGQSEGCYDGTDR